MSLIPESKIARAARGLRCLVASAGLIWAGAAAAAVTFDPPVVSDLAGPGAGDSLVHGDLDHDCILDLVAVRDETVASETLSIIVRIGDGLGAFAGGTLSAGTSLTDLELADIDRDGSLDLISTESFESLGFPTGLCASQDPRVPVLLGDGLGGFVLGACLIAKDHPSAVVAGDFDENGAPDLFVLNAPTSGSGATSQEALLFRGVGDGTFLPGEVVFLRRGLDVEAADLDGDGHLDLAIAGVSSTFVYLGGGDGTFVPLGAGITGTSNNVALGDVNGDGAPDVAAVGSDPLTSGDDVVWIALNLADGSGGFAPPTSYPTGQHPVDVAVVDLDLDLLDDVVVANNLGNSVSVFLATANGSLGAMQQVAAGQDPMALVVADLNQDGFPDVVVSNRNEIAGEIGDGTLTTLLQQASAPLAVASDSLPDGEVGFAYSTCLAARGGTGPYAWQLGPGSLPQGITLASTGRISGVPTVNGTSDFTVEVQDNAAAGDSRLLSITVCLDADGDGFSDCRGDCDDGDPERFPGNPEICDGKDNDCDQIIDSGQDGDGDGVDDLCDNCPSTINPRQDDGDADGAGDACDGCPADPAKVEPGVCGCGVADTDGDGDGTPDCDDGCPTDPDKTAPGVCGCGTPDTDGDGDGFAACVDCDDGNPECTTNCTDLDGDGYCVTVDCNDGAPEVHPGAAELPCDATDNDCSPATPDIFDLDGDGWACDLDCDEGNVQVHPGAAEVGCDGIDNDCSPATADVRDADTDGYLCNVDCDDTNGQAWSAPGSTTTLVVADDRQTVSWLAPYFTGAAPATVRYDLVRAGDPSSFLDTGLCVECVAWGEGPDPSAVDLQVPASGRVFYYLSRAVNDCPNGIGTLGTDSSLVQRTATCGVQNVDSDADGTPDCAEDCPLDPNKLVPGVCGCGVPELLGDADLDGVVTCMDCDDLNPDCRTDCSDNDEDLHCAPFDCDDGSSFAWGPPGEAGSLVLSADRQGLDWQPPTDAGGDPTRLRYDILRSDNPADFLGSIVCVETGGGPDTSAIDLAAPGPGGTFYYLVRATNDCAGMAGTLGTASTGQERLGGVCP
jgi:hypothetical protein